MIIKNGLVYGEDANFVKRDLYIDSNHKITDALPKDDCEVIDAEGLYVIPGLVDIHVHGALGYEFDDGNANENAEIAAYFKSQGVTSLCPSTSSRSVEQLGTALENIMKIPNDGAYSRVVGVHMEGPFISAKKKGAMLEEYISEPSKEVFQRLNACCGGNVKLITIAPEIPGAKEFIDQFHDSVTISLGHTEADYELADWAYKSGVSQATHLFNAMPPIHHRKPGVIGAAADNPHVMVQLICDGLHVHPSVVRMVYHLFGDDRVVLISDAVAATGLEDGVHQALEQTIVKSGGSITLPDGTLAGSATTLYECMKKAVSFGIPLETAIKWATCNPAKSIGVDTVGSLEIGKEADVLLIDKELNLIKVI